MVRNKMPDFENQERGRKCGGELLVFIIPSRLNGSLVFCNQFDFRIYKKSVSRRRVAPTLQKFLA